MFGFGFSLWIIALWNTTSLFPTNSILAEDGSALLTEGGDFLLTES